MNAEQGKTWAWPEATPPDPFSAAIKKSVKPARPPRVGVTPLTDEEWGNLEGKARWDSIVALRGPDSAGSELLKYFTTSVIRYKLSKVMRVGGMVNNVLPCVVVRRSFNSSSGSKFNSAHFLGHIVEAAQWLGIPICWCNEDTWKLMNDQPSAGPVFAALAADEQVQADLRAIFAKWGGY